MKMRAFDLFCGAGGSSCGARMAGISPAGGIDFCNTAADTYELNFPGTKTYRQRIGPKRFVGLQNDIPV